MKRIVLIWVGVVGLILQSCGLALLDPNARNQSLPVIPLDEFTVGGEVVGLPLAYDLEAEINDLSFTVTQDGVFTTPYAFEDETTYTVTVGDLPGGYQCMVENSEGTIQAQDITDVLIVCSCMPGDTIQGDGTEQNPIEIWTAVQLNNVALDTQSSSRTLSYRQMCDLDYTEIIPTPIGSNASPFTGSYDGQGFAISNYTTGAQDPYVNQRKGLFGLARNATLKNMYLNQFLIAPHSDMRDDDIQTGAMGSLAAVAHNTSITEVFAKNIVIDAPLAVMECAGGLVGNVHAVAPGNAPEQSTLQSVHMQNVVIDAPKTAFVGGVIGGATNKHAVMENIVGDHISVASCNGYCGGVVGNLISLGSNFDQTRLSKVHLFGSTVNGDGEVGGIAGCVSGNLDQLIFDGEVLLTDQTTTFVKEIGGLVGRIRNAGANESGLKNSFALADVRTETSSAEIGAVYGSRQGTDIERVSYGSGFLCENCANNNDVVAQDNIITFVEGQDPSQNENPLIWDFSNTWCLQPPLLPSLVNVPFSQCD